MVRRRPSGNLRDHQESSTSFRPSAHTHQHTISCASPNSPASHHTPAAPAAAQCRRSLASRPPSSCPPAPTRGPEAAAGSSPARAGGCQTSGQRPCRRTACPPWLRHMTGGGAGSSSAAYEWHTGDRPGHRVVCDAAGPGYHTLTFRHPRRGAGRRRAGGRAGQQARRT